MVKKSIFLTHACPKHSPVDFEPLIEAEHPKDK
jgi:hypothetical protein